MPRKFKRVVDASSSFDEVSFQPLMNSESFVETRKVFKGSNQDEEIEGSGSDDQIDGLGGDDVLWGLGGNDVLIGGLGDDRLFGQQGANTLIGGDGDDWLSGSGRDHLVGGDGNDEFDVSGKDLAIGGDGNDVFNIYNNHPTIKGGNGYDVAKFDLRSENFVAEYEDSHLLLHTDYSGFYKPRLLLSDTSIEKIVWKDFELDLRRVSTPKITNLRDGEVQTFPINAISGTASPFAHIRILADDVVVGHTAADRQGRWSLVLRSSDIIRHSAEIVAIADYGNAQSRSSKPVSVDINAALSLEDINASQGVILRGMLDFEGIGISSSCLGDINGDGQGDVAVSASLSGVTYAIFGAQHALGNVTNDVSRLAPATMSFEQGLEINWTVAGNESWQVAGAAGDFNGDGVNDILLGSFTYNAAVVLYGGKWSAGIGGAGEHVSLDVSQLSPEAGIFLEGGETLAISGRNMSAVGDFNGDGFDDLIVGASEASSNSAFIVFGDEGGPGEVKDEKTKLLLSNMEQSQGLQITGLDAFSGVFGAGDVNGDGLDDVIVKTNDDIPTYAIIYGSVGPLGEVQGGGRSLDAGAIDDDLGFYIDAGALHAWDISHVSRIGDTNGDGFEDIALASRGNVTVIYGATDPGNLIDGRRVIDPHNLSAQQGFTMRGEASSSTELNVAAAGDFNGDGLDDFLISRLLYREYHYKTFLIFGSRHAPGETSDGQTSCSLLNLPSALGREYRTDGVPAISSAGDVNGDGFDDIVVGDPHAAFSKGRAYIIYGYNTSSASPLTLSGTSAAEILRGRAGDDTLNGKGGADIFRGGAGDDTIRIGDADVLQIRAGGGMNDRVLFGGAGIALDGRDFGASQLTGIEGFDITGTGDNALTLTAFDVFHLSPNRNATFSAGLSGNTLVVEGDDGDTLRLIDPSDATWTLVHSYVGLDGEAGGDFDIYQLMDGAEVRASVAVSADVALLH